MLDDLHVRDFYVSLEKYPHVCASCSVKDAVALMHDALTEKHKYRTVLVYDDIHQLLGYLSLRDLMHALGPDYFRRHTLGKNEEQPYPDEISQDLTALSIIWQDEFTRKIKDAAKKPVSEVMSPLREHVKLDDPVAKCIYKMLTTDVFVLPVVQDEEVVGIIRLFDMFDIIADCLEKNGL